jgi:hypothetical protein
LSDSSPAKAAIGDRLFNAVISGFGARVTRRRLLARSAIVGSALMVDPWRYVLRPVSALGVIRCADCNDSDLCCDGWTAFCCTINDGKNECPQDSFMAGWWKCTDYNGSLLCADEGVRYYIDCNRTPGKSCDGGCHCANDQCSNRSTCCNIFRYGQCNTDVPETTEVVCRMITCVNPCQLFEDCKCNSFVENAVCGHDSGCLCRSCGPEEEVDDLAWLLASTM